MHVLLNNHLAYTQGEKQPSYSYRTRQQRTARLRFSPSYILYHEIQNALLLSIDLSFVYPSLPIRTHSVVGVLYAAGC